MNARQEWLQSRQAGIGGSDVSAIFGLNPWKTPLDVYRSKVEPVQADEEVKEAAYWGMTLEDVVAKEFAIRQGKKIQRVNAQLKSSTRPWMMANIDRAIVIPGSRVRVADDGGSLLGAEGVLECKTASAYKASDWGRDDDEDAIPLHYQFQGMWYLGVTGLPYCDFAALIGGQKFVTKRIERDDAVIQSIIERCEAFWFDHVQKRIPPEPINAKDVTNLFPSDNGEVIEANEQTLIAYNEAVVLRKQIDDAETELEKRVETIKKAIGERAALATMGKTLITWKAAKSSVKTDWKATADQIKGWMIEHGIDQGVDAVREIIDQNTKTVEGSRRFLFAKQ